MAIGNVVLSPDNPKRVEFSTDASHLVYFELIADCTLEGATTVVS